MGKSAVKSVLFRHRATFFRLGAVILGLAPLLVCEGLLWCCGLGEPRYDHDPFVGFRTVHPLFVLSEDGQRYQIAQSRLAFFRPDSFAAHKAPDEFRIFCLGGSTVQGNPFTIETSFTTFLELSLQAAQPDRRWEVVNCGGVSYASYRLVPILEEVLRYQPDLIIVYTGQNEFLEDRTYGHIKRMPEFIARPAEMLAETRSYRVLHQIWRGEGPGEEESQEAFNPGRPVLADEVEAMLEYRGGLEKYQRDEKWRQDVVAHFRYNLNRMVAMAGDAGVALLLCNPVCQLRDCPPFKNQHRDGLTEEELQRWQELVFQAGDHIGENPAETVALLEEAMKLDDQHAGLHYMLAETHDSMGQLGLARREYLAAKELDVCPLRILESMNEAVLETARATGTPLVDVRQMYERICEGGIPGGMYLVDHVHPSIEGHQLIADLIASRLSLMGIVRPVADWRERRNAAFRAQLDSLDSLYYAKGEQRLDVLKCWTQGKAGQNWSYKGEKPVFFSEPMVEGGRE